MCDTCEGHRPARPQDETTPIEHGHVHSEPDAGIRVVVVGKGGVGKSTLSALLARQFARGGARVVAVDADEQQNLAAALGVEFDAASAIVPLAQALDYIEEKTGARPGEGAGAMLRLNPDTHDLIDRLSVLAPDGVRLVVMGGIRRAGGGCLCPETALVSAAVAGMHLHDDDVVVMDTHAGVEHFGRALARGFDSAVVVVEPSFNAVQVGLESARLAGDLGISEIHLAINRVRMHSDVERVASYVERLGGFGFTSVNALPFDEAVAGCEPAVSALLDRSSLADAAKALSAVLASGGLRPVGAVA